MSSINIANARNLQVNDVHVRRIFDLTPRVFDMFDDLPWRAIEGESLEVPRVAKDTPAGFASPLTGGLGVVSTTPSANPGTDFTAGASVAAKLPYDPNIISYYVKELVGDIDMSAFTQHVLSWQNPQREFQVDAKLTATSYAFAQQFIAGAGTVAADVQMSGLDQIILGLDGSQTVATPAAGNRRKTRGVDLLLSLIRDNTGQVDFLLMNFDGLVALQDGIRAAGAEMNFVPDPRTGLLAPYYNGVRIYLNDFIATNIAELSTSIYAGVLGADCGLYAIYPGGVGNRGLIVSDATKHPTADYNVTRVHWFCGLAVLGGRALAKLTGFGTATGA